MRAGPVGRCRSRRRRDAALVVAVEVRSAPSTCFCTSMGTGPEVRGGADLVLAELDDGFTVRAGSPAGPRSSHVWPCPRPPTPQIDGRGRPGRGRPGDHRRPGPDRGPAGTARAARSTIHAGPRSPSGAWRAPTARSCVRPASARAWRRVRPRRHRRLDRARVGQLLQPRVRAGRRRRELPAGGRQTAIASGSRTSSRPGGTSSARRGCVGCGRCIAWCPVGIDVREELVRSSPRCSRRGRRSRGRSRRRRVARRRRCALVEPATT